MRATHRIGEQHHRVVAVRRKHDHFAVARFESLFEVRIARQLRGQCRKRGAAARRCDREIQQGLPIYRSDGSKVNAECVARAHAAQNIAPASAPHPRITEAAIPRR